MGTSYDYDVIVIGAGIAGMVAAVTANGLGKRVAVVEKGKIGGNCTNFTCIPSKTLIRLSHTSQQITRLERLGILSPDAPLFRTQNIMSHIRSVVTKAYEKDLPETFEDIGITVLQGSAAFLDRHHIQIKGRTLSAAIFIIAVGTRPVIPPISGITEVAYLTNETLYDMDDLPKSLVILGGGVDGLEYGSAFGRLGVETTIVEQGPRPLPAADRELVNVLHRALESDGIRLLLSTKATSLRKCQGGVVLGYESPNRVGELTAEKVLVALGRRPDLEELALDKAGVNVTPRGVIVDKTLRTSAPNIYACGDIVGPDQLASMAEYQGILAATNAILPIKRKVKYETNVYVIFTEPTLAFLGLTEAQARAKYGHTLQVYRFDYADMRRALIDGTAPGLGKFLCDGRGRLIGAHILGEGAAEVIHEAQVIKAMGKSLHKFHLITHAYPTYAQALVGRASQLAFLDMMGRSLGIRAALRVWPGIQNKLALARDRLAENRVKRTEKRSAEMKIIGEGASARTEHIRVRSVSLNDDACLIALPDDLMDHDERPILGAYTCQRFGAPKVIVLNFSRVRRMNGLGASMLVKLSARAAKAGQNLFAYGLGTDLTQVFEVTELDQAIQLLKRGNGAFLNVSVFSEDSPDQLGDKSTPLVNAINWAKPVSELFVPFTPNEARNLNVNGLRAVGPVNGFGRLMEKVFRLHINDPTITAEKAIAALKENFPLFQPKSNRFYPSSVGIQAGEIVLIDAMTPGGPVSTGVRVLYADERSFTFNTPQGHPECGFVSFSGEETDHGLVIQIVGLARASDPLYELAFILMGSRVQTRIWIHVLASLAAYLGVPADITFQEQCVDNRLLWSQVRNIFHNAQIRTLIHEPKRWFRKE